ncbi:hypothetical protein IQ268_08715 [Oculatella sp. LEGE 06141]|uniref:ribbon-helix-helix domain-containing protein n=1 Tax=Oculatella sp. LEGE 06141 TaxID=1828648 RepID=UPI00187E98C5|nr:hypothetical protein [Oculatella sp. LEGE 06141]
MSKRVFLTLPDGVAADLKRWADSESNNSAGLAGFLVEQAVRQAKEEGKIPPPPGGSPLPEYKSLSQLVMHNLSKLAESGKLPQKRLKELMDGDRPTEVEVLRIALLLELTEEYVSDLPINGGVNGDKTKTGTK